MTAEAPPVHDSLHVVGYADIYHNDEWRKSVVRYKFDRDNDYDEVAVYLWHNDDDGWKRKNKYVIKTIDAWKTDKTIVDQLFSNSTSTPPNEEFPVSDYYRVAAGETIFQSDGWWKAILKIDRKGSYETEEVMVYLWQESDDDWRRRQKYTIKSESKWADEVEAIESIVDVDTEATVSQQETDETRSGGEPLAGASEFEELAREIDKHLSESSK